MLSFYLFFSGALIQTWSFLNWTSDYFIFPFCFSSIVFVLPSGRFIHFIFQTLCLNFSPDIIFLISKNSFRLKYIYIASCAYFLVVAFSVFLRTLMILFSIQQAFSFLFFLKCIVLLVLVSAFYVKGFSQIYRFGAFSRTSTIYDLSLYSQGLDSRVPSGQKAFL